MSSGKLITPSGYHRSWRALIAAKYSGSAVSTVNFIPGETDTDPNFLCKFPPSTTPVFESNDGTCLFDANAIAFYLGTDQLRGGKSEHLVTQWTNFADNSLMPSVATWVYPCLGVTQCDKQATEKAKSHVNAVLTYLDGYLRKVTYLVGDRLTQADITLFTALHPLFTHVIDADAQKKYAHVVRWFTTVANQPNVLSVVGSVKMCVKEATFDPKKFAELHPKDNKPIKQEKQVKKEKPAKKEQAPKPAKETPVDNDGDDEPKPVKSKNPFANLPDGDFDMDAFKRVYSNEDIESVGIPYFWQHFDPTTHSLWYCEYKYPEELEMIFMTSNLIGGMFQRLERMLKYGFGSMCIFGENGKNTIKGLWFWRGTGLAFDLSEDLQVDYDSYEWKKLDPATPETKALVREYFMQSFEDKSFNQGKIFK